MHRSHFRIKFLKLLFVFLLALLPGSATAIMSLPPLGYLGISPWSQGYSTPIPLLKIKIKNSYGDPWPDGWVDTWKIVPLEGTSEIAYVSGVVIGELGGASLKSGWPYNGWLWHDEAVKAQSIASRSFGTYNAKRRIEGSDVGIYNDESDQVYRPFRLDVPALTKQRYRDLTEMYRGLYLAYSALPTQRHKVNLIEALFKRDVGNPTPSLWDPNPGNSYPYLPSVADPQSTGAVGGPGMSQLPLQGWTAIGGGNVTFWQLLSHYYPNTTLMNTQSTWTVDYYYSQNSNGCTGNIEQTVTTKWINFDWDTGSLGILNDGRDPGSTIHADNVCINFTTTASFATDWYTFYIVADDGFKLLIDDVEVGGYWGNQDPTMYAINVPIIAGNHIVRLKFYEQSGGAVARMSWRRWNGMLGRYYDNVMPKGNEPPRNQIIMERFDPTVRFAWDTSSPLDTQETPDSPYPKIVPDSFAAVWTSSIFIPYQSSDCRTLNFSAMTDDGMYVTIGGIPYLDQWQNQPPTPYTFSACLYPGNYELKVYYYESIGGATARLSWN